MYRIVPVYNMQRNLKLVYWIVDAVLCRAVLFAFEPAMRMEEGVMDERDGGEGWVFRAAGIVRGRCHVRFITPQQTCAGQESYSTNEGWETCLGHFFFQDICGISHRYFSEEMPSLTR